MTEYLDDIEGLDLVQVEYAGRLRQKNERRVLQMLESSRSRGTGLRHNNKHRQLLKSISIPLRVTVLGTIDISDFALSYLMEIIRTNVLTRLVTYLRENANLTGSTVVMTADTFDFTDILTGSTNPPTGKPTPMPINQKNNVQTQSMEEDNGSGGGMLWWIWLLIVLAILSILLCVCIYCSKRRKSKSEEKQQQAMYTWMKTGSTGSSYSTRTNPNSVSMRSQQQRRRYDYDNEDELFLGQAMNVRRSRYNEGKYYDEESRRPHQKRSRQRQASRKQRSSKPKKKRRDHDRERSKKKKRRKPQARDEQLQIEYGDYNDELPHQGALVLYDTNDNRGNRGGALVPYDAFNQSYGTKEPEGNKVSKMKSMYAAEAYAIESLANNTRQTEEPEGKNADEVYSVIKANHDDAKNTKLITYDDIQDEDYKERKRSKKSKTENNSLQDEDENGPVIYCNETDEPSMMTNHNDY